MMNYRWRGARACATTLLSCSGAAGAQPVPLLGSELEHIAYQEFRVFFRISVKAGGGRTGEYVTGVLVAEKTRGHGGAGRHHGGVEHPTLGPAGLQAIPGHQKTGGRGFGIVL